MGNNDVDDLDLGGRNTATGGAFVGILIGISTNTEITNLLNDPLKFIISENLLALVSDRRCAHRPCRRLRKRSRQPPSWGRNQRTSRQLKKTQTTKVSVGPQKSREISNSQVKTSFQMRIVVSLG